MISTLETAHGRQRTLWTLLPYLVAVAALIITLVAAWQIHRIETARRAALLHAWDTQLRDRVHGQMEDYVVLLRGLAGLFAAGDEVTDLVFRRYIHSLELETHYPGVVGLGTAFHLESEQELAPFGIEQMHAFDDRPEDVSDLFFPTLHFAPDASPWDRLRGYDMVTHPAARQALLQCWNESKPIVSPAMQIWPDDEQNSAQMLLFVPLEPPEFPDPMLEDLPERRWSGIVFAMVHSDRFWQKTLGPDVDADFDLWILQPAEAPGEEEVVWTNTDAAEPPPPRRLAVHGRITAAGQPWTVKAARNTGLAQWVFDLRLALAALAVGLAFAAVLFVCTHAQGRARRLAEVRTEQLRHAQQDLERRVAQRTAEAETRTVQLRTVAGQLTQAEQTERRRLAQVLHDHLQQLLVAMRFQIGTLSRRLEDPDLQHCVTNLQKLLAESIDTSRTLTAELSPPVLYERGLGAAFRWLGQWMEQKHGLHVDLHIDQQAELEDEHLRVLAFQAVRELLFNTVKYAEVDQAYIHCRCAGEGYVEINVVDEGRGFEPSAAAQHREEGGFGLFTIRERLELVGGEMHLWSRPGHGTTARLLLPSHPPSLHN